MISDRENKNENIMEWHDVIKFVLKNGYTKTGLSLAIGLRKAELNRALRLDYSRLTYSNRLRLVDIYKKEIEKERLLLSGNRDIMKGNETSSSHQSSIIVGENFKQQLKHKKMISVNEYVNAKSKTTSIEFVLGQGLSRIEIDFLNLINSNNGKIRKASKKVTHKIHEKNIMISEVKEKVHHHYSCQLLLDENCAEMSDHITGKHIQAMVLVEAARQMNNAVCEQYLINEDQRERITLVLDKLETNFKRYIYPLTIGMDYELITLRKTSAGFFKASSKVVFIQNREVCTEIILYFSGMDKEFLTDKEDSGIGELVDAMTYKKSIRNENE